MTDHDVRDFLERMATEEPVQFLDAEPLTRRARRRAARTVFVGALGVAAAVAVLFAGVSELRSTPRVPADPPVEPSVDLGIFEPAAGRIVYCKNSDLWSIDPNAPAPASTLQSVDSGGTGDPNRPCASFTVPLGWSSDGTKLLYMREDPTDDSFPYRRHLYILHADGTETKVTPEPVGGAAISPDGSQVVFAADSGRLYGVDAEGGEPVRIADEGESPTFSPDGAQIAYLSESGRAGIEHVWVANADGTDAHQILTDETLDMGMGKLTWSPAGDRIAIENQLEGHVAIYTLAPDGSNFSNVISGGFNHSWSPDGSQIAFGLPGRDGVSIADADGSNVRTLGVGAAGPWHPGMLGQSAEPPASPTPSTSPRPSTSTGSSTFTSAIHGVAIDHPSGWETRPATEPWTGEPLDFDSPAADVIFDPSMGERLYLAIASQPYGGLSEDAWRNKATRWLCTGEGMAAGSWTVDGADTWVMTCGSTASAALVFTETRGYVIRLVAPSDEPGLAATYDWDWHKEVLETVDLRSEEALDAPSPSVSP